MAKWKHVTGAEQGGARRPHLTLNDELVGVGPTRLGRLTTRRNIDGGYLCGMIRGDGQSRLVLSMPSRGAGMATIHRFRLALADFEALRRTPNTSLTSKSRPMEFLFHAAVGNQREIHAIRTSAKGRVRRNSGG